MDQVDKSYELTILKTAIDMYLDKTITFTEEGLQLLESNRDRFVWEVSTNIYVQSGHKVEFYIARDGVNSWLENKKVQLVKFRWNQKEQARQIAEEKAHLAVENARQIAEEKVRREEQARQIAEEKVRQIAETKAHRIKEINKFADRGLEQKINGCEKEHIIKHLGNHKAGIFFELKRVIIEQLSVEPDSVNLDSDISNDLNADSLDAVELIMAIEEEFDIKIPDEAAYEITTIEQALDFLYNKLQLELALLGE